MGVEFHFQAVLRTTTAGKPHPWPVPIPGAVVEEWRRLGYQPVFDTPTAPPTAYPVAVPSLYVRFRSPSGKPFNPYLIGFNLDERRQAAPDQPPSLDVHADVRYVYEGSSKTVSRDFIADILWPLIDYLNPIVGWETFGDPLYPPDHFGHEVLEGRIPDKAGGSSLVFLGSEGVTRIGPNDLRKLRDLVESVAPSPLEDAWDSHGNFIPVPLVKERTDGGILLYPLPYTRETDRILWGGRTWRPEYDEVPEWLLERTGGRQQ